MKGSVGRSGLTLTAAASKDHGRVLVVDLDNQNQCTPGLMPAEFAKRKKEKTDF